MKNRFIRTNGIVLRWRAGGKKRILHLEEVEERSSIPNLDVWLTTEEERETGWNLVWR